MSHNLATINGRTAMMYNARGGKPWHGLGTAIDGAATWQQAVQMAGLDWTVSKRSLYNSIGVRVDAWGTFRDTDDVFLGVVGSGYTPIQHADAFGFMDTLMEAENGAHYESAGALGRGEKFWGLARVPYDFRINGYDDKHETYLLFASSHDGSMAATAKLTTVRVVCNNTLNVALGTGAESAIRIKHTAHSPDRLAAAKKLLSGAAQSASTLRGKLEELARLFESNDGNAIPEIRGTAYNLLNACTEWCDHHRSVRVTDDRKGMSVDTIRKQSAMFEYDSWKDKAIDAILTATETAARKDFHSIAVPVSSRISSILDKVAI